MREPDFLLFASDATLLAVWGAVFIVLAIGSMVMDRRRLKRTEINRVGWVPWTPLFLLFAVLGGGLLAVAVPALVAG